MSNNFRFVHQLETPVPSGFRQLCEFTNPTKFSKLSEEELAKHITEVRNKAYEITPYPCLAGFNFLRPSVAHGGPPHTYPLIVEHLKANRQAKVLDLGCCFGADARQLVKDGVRPDQIVACDLIPALIDCGFDMFADGRDQGVIKGLRWEKVDIFNDDDVEHIRQPDGYYAIHTGSFIHLFPLEWQRKVLVAVNSLLSRERGSVVWGRQVGVPPGQAGAMARIGAVTKAPNGVKEGAEDKDTYFHDVDSFKKLIDEASPGGWNIEVDEHDWQGLSGTGDKVISSQLLLLRKRLSFAFTRK